MYSALDLVDGYYQLLMRASDTPLTAVSFPSGMLREWMGMPQELSNAPAIFYLLVTQLFRPHRAYAERILMTYLLIAVLNRFIQKWITTSTTYGLCLSACARIICTLMRQKHLQCGRDSIFGVLHGEARPSSGSCKSEGHSGFACSSETKGSASGLALPITCTSIARITLIWLGHCTIFFKRMWGGAGLAPKMRIQGRKRESPKCHNFGYTRP